MSDGGKKSAPIKSELQYYKPEKLPEVLYHYCNTANFKAIVESGELWLSNSRAMNDYLETKWIEQVVGAYFRLESNEGGDEQFRELVWDMYRALHYDTYFACFSTDGDVLSQWRAYADDGHGFALGLSTSAFGFGKHLPFKIFDWDTGPDTGFHQVIYSSDAQQELVVSAFEDLPRFMGHLDDNAGAVGCAVQLRRLSSVLKSDKFSEEKEWRIIQAPQFLEGDSGVSTPSISLSQSQFRLKGRDLIPYTVLSIPGERTEIISDVKKGPKNNIDDGFLSEFLKLNGYRSEVITKSEISYR